MKSRLQPEISHHTSQRLISHFSYQHRSSSPPTPTIINHYGPLSPRTDRQRARQIQRLHAKHQESSPLNYADLLMDEDVALANALEPGYKELFDGEVYPPKWTLTRGSLSTAQRMQRKWSKERLLRLLKLKLLKLRLRLRYNLMLKSTWLAKSLLMKLAPLLLLSARPRRLEAQRNLQLSQYRRQKSPKS